MLLKYIFKKRSNAPKIHIYTECMVIRILILRLLIFLFYKLFGTNCFVQTPSIHNYVLINFIEYKKMQ